MWGGVKVLDGSVEWDVQQGASVASVESVNARLSEQIAQKANKDISGEFKLIGNISGYISGASENIYVFIPFFGAKGKSIKILEAKTNIRQLGKYLEPGLITSGSNLLDRVINADIYTSDLGIEIVFRKGSAWLYSDGSKVVNNEEAMVKFESLKLQIS